MASAAWQAKIDVVITQAEGSKDDAGGDEDEEEV